MSVASVPVKFARDPAVPADLGNAMTTVASKYVQPQIDNRGDRFVISYDIKAAYERAMEQLHESLNRIQTKHKTDQTENFFACRAVDVWKEAVADPVIASQLKDIQALSQVMKISVPVKVGFSSPMHSLEEPHNQLMERIDWLHSSCELYSFLEKIEANVASGVSIFDPSQISQIRNLIANWKVFIGKFPDQSQNAEFIKRFEEVVKADGISFMSRVYFHVWDQAVKAGDNPWGDDFGKCTAFDKIGRLQTAIALAEGELLARAIDSMPKPSRRYSEEFSAENPTAIASTPIAV